MTFAGNRVPSEAQASISRKRNGLSRTMNFALLAIFTAALVGHGKGDVSWVDPNDADLQPCQQKSYASNYRQFVGRHILNESIDGTDCDKWRRYLVEKHLCGRTHVQTFIEADEGQVSKICGTSGKRVVNGGNLCISKSRMRVYVVKSHVEKGQCFVSNVAEGDHRIVLACNKVNKTCLPVHYEKWTNQRAGRQDCNKS